MIVMDFIELSEIDDDNLEDACSKHRYFDDLLIHIKGLVNDRIKYRKLTRNEIYAYKYLKHINDLIIDKILEFVNKKGYTLVPIEN